MIVALSCCCSSGEHGLQLPAQVRMGTVYSELGTSLLTVLMLTECALLNVGLHLYFAIRPTICAISKHPVLVPARHYPEFRFGLKSEAIEEKEKSHLFGLHYQNLR